MDHCKTTFCRSMMLPVLFIVLLVFISSISATTLITPIPHDGEAVAQRSWPMTGPFPSPTLVDREPEYPVRAGYNTDFLTELGGEAVARPVEGTEVRLPDGMKATFERYEWDGDFINLVPHFGWSSEVLVYLYTEVENPEAQEVYVHIGINDAGKLWMNGKHATKRTACSSSAMRRSRSLGSSRYGAM
jgi:hypothetical protein